MWRYVQIDCCVYVCVYVCARSRFARCRKGNSTRERARTRQMACHGPVTYRQPQTEKYPQCFVSSNLLKGPVKHALVKDGGR